MLIGCLTFLHFRARMMDTTKWRQHKQCDSLLQYSDGAGPSAPLGCDISLLTITERVRRFKYELTYRMLDSIPRKRAYPAAAA